MVTWTIHQSYHNISKQGLSQDERVPNADDVSLIQLPLSCYVIILGDVIRYTLLFYHNLIRIVSQFI